jgi:hypothetical protein
MKRPTAKANARATSISTKEKEDTFSRKLDLKISLKFTVLFI